VTIDDLPGPSASAPSTVKLVIPASVVLGPVKDAMPIDATIVGYDAATDRIELTIASDFYWQPADSGS
jgi:hypothetical protein